MGTTNRYDVAVIGAGVFGAWTAWHLARRKQRVLLVGYSFGADVLPFVVNRLPPDLRDRVASVSLLGIDSNAARHLHHLRAPADRQHALDDAERKLGRIRPDRGGNPGLFPVP